jgi:hypothetical protein
MAAELVKCRVRRNGYMIERGEIMIHVDFAKGDSDEVLRRALENVAGRDGRGRVGEYELELLDSRGNVIGNYVSGK